MKLAIVGSRSITDKSIVYYTLSQIYDISLIISGGARGVDSIAEEYAKSVGIPVKIYYAEWDKYGRGAGMIRNSLILKECDKLIAFWDGKSVGTENSIRRAIKSGKLLSVHI